MWILSVLWKPTRILMLLKFLLKKEMLNMNKSHPIPYEVLLDGYWESQQEIEYLEYKILTLNDEIDA